VKVTEDRLFPIFESVCGSQLYGTNTPASDTDWRGVVIPPIQVYFGTQKFEQLETKKPDRVLYSIDKAVKLVAACNPNMIELLFVPEQFIEHCHPFWQRMIDNRDLFVSKKARHTFSGYAFSQLRRIKQHQRWLTDAPEQPDREAMGLNPHKRDFNEDHLNALRIIPRDLIQEDHREIIRAELAYSAAQREWKEYQRWCKERNPARLHLEQQFGFDVKHASHLVRLLRMGEEILDGRGVIVNRRGVDADELKSILQGAWSYDELVAYADAMDAKLDALYETSTLQHEPDHAAIENLLMGVFEEHFGLKIIKNSV